MNQDINLNLYKVFYFVATLKSFKKASDKLCVSQPAISKQIKNLEEILEVKLFYRYNKGIELTNEGKLLLQNIEKMNFYLEAAHKDIGMFKKNLIGNIVIGCPSHIASFYLLDFITIFKNKYKNVDVRIISDSTSSLIEQLKHHKLDFIIDSLPMEIDGQTMKKKFLEDFETVFVVNNDFNDDIKTPNDLQGKTFILPLPRSAIRKKLEEKFYEYEIDYRVGLEVDTTDLIISAVKRDLGIGYVTKKSINEEITKKQLKVLNANIEMPKLELYLVYNKEYLSYQSRELLNNIMNICV